MMEKIFVLDNCKLAFKIIKNTKLPLIYGIILTHLIILNLEFKDES